MANIKSQVKRNVQNEKSRKKNVSAKSAVRSARKKIVTLLESKEKAGREELAANFNDFVKTVDSAARKGIIHKNTAARKKSRLAKAINKASQIQA